jgi:nucleoside-diphosphate-sugar epimerase
VRGLVRKREGAKSAAQHVEWVEGDAMQAADVLRAAQGVSVIVHAVNPPGYQNWETLAVPMLENAIAAAKAVGARVVLPGTIYNYDPKTTPVIDEMTAQKPPGKKGAVRVEMEQRLRAEAEAGTPALIVRAGDFFGPGMRSSWFAQAMIAPNKPVTRIINTAKGGGHSWAYLPDLAETFARLLDVEDKLQPFEVVQFRGFYDASGTGMIEAIRDVVGRKVPVWGFPWWLMHATAVFGGFPREASEVAQFWAHPIRFDNTRLEALIGPEPHTPLNEGVREALREVKALPEGQ